MFEGLGKAATQLQEAGARHGARISKERFLESGSSRQKGHFEDFKRIRRNAARTIRRGR